MEKVPILYFLLSRVSTACSVSLGLPLVSPIGPDVALCSAQTR